MNILKKKIVISLLGLSILVVPAIAQGATAAELQTQIDNLMAQLATLQSQLSALQGTTPTVSGCSITSFDRNLKQGDTGDDVKCLQIVLNSASDTQVASSGVGSSGNETTYFGPLTKGAVIKFQEKYASEILASWGLTSGTGFVGSTTRTKLNSLLTAPVTPPAAEEEEEEEEVTTTEPGALSVSLSSDTPAAVTIPANATAAAYNTPITKVTFTAGDGDVTITGLKVTRSGLSQDAAIAAIRLLDGTVQVGTNQSLGSNHKASFTNISIKVAANTSKTITLAANMTVAATYSGNIIQLGIDSADDITSDATGVTGSFPMKGNQMTLTSSVTIGTATLYNGSSGTRNTTDLTVDPNDADVVFTQVKITAGSGEGLKVTQITAVKNGTAAASDVKDLKLVNDTSGETLATVSALNSDGRAVFSGLSVNVDKGNSVELSVLASMNNSGSGRTIAFDLHDGVAYTIDISGTTYGFGITPTRSNFCALAGTCTAQTINQGYLTVQKSSKTPATGNVSLGGSQVELAAFDYTAAGESINITSTQITITPANSQSATTGRAADYTNVTGYDANGNVLFGPQDGTTTTVNTAQALTFTDAYTVPIGTTIVSIKANISSSALANETVVVSMVLNTITAKGASSGKTTYTTSTGSTVPPSSTVTANTMTIAGPALNVITAATPIVGNVVVNAQDEVFGNFDFITSASGEDVKVTTIIVTDTLGAGAAVGDLLNLEMFDGSTKLETTNSTAVNAATVTFTLKTPLKIAKGTTKRLTLKADVASGANTGSTATHAYNIASVTDRVVATGWSTGAAMTETYAGSGQAQTIQARGTLQVTVDAARPAAAQFVAGTTGNSMMIYRLYANYEAIDITQLYIATTSGSAQGDIANVKLYYDGSQIGNAGGYTLDAGGDAHVVLASGTMVVKKSTYHTLNIKVDLADKTSLTDAATLEIGLGVGASYNDADWGANGAAGSAGTYYYIIANGKSSGSTITRTAINTTVSATTGTVAASFVQYLYDGVLVVSKNINSPKSTQTAGANQEVLRLDLQAIGDDITVNEMEFCIAGTATGVTGTGDVTIKSDDLGTTYATLTQSGYDAYWDTLVGASTYYSMDPGTEANCFSIGDDAQTANSVAGKTAKNIEPFTTTLQVASGTTKTVRIFGDTTGAATTLTLQLNLETNSSGTYNVTASGVEWENNGGTDVDSALTKNTPVTGGALSY